jgi:hypothetical protein
MSQLFVVTRTRGTRWNHVRTLEEQDHWQDHATFMNGLVHDGFVLLGGPLEGTPEVLLIVRTTHVDHIMNRLADDPWSRNGLLRIAHVHPWTLRLGSLPTK